jgi:hypothetical protein
MRKVIKTGLGVIALSSVVFASALPSFTVTTSAFPNEIQEVYKDPTNVAPKDLTKAELVQAKYDSIIDDAMREVFGSYEGFEEYGVFYYVNEPEPKLVFGFNRSDIKIESLKKILKNTIPDNLLVFKNVEYSSAELTVKLKEISKDIKQYGVNSYGLGRNVSGQKIELTIEEKYTEVNKLLQEKYGEILEIITVQELGGFLLSRTKNYNNLGAGIGITMPETNNKCSTAGIGYKYNATAGKNNYYIITAGHCINKNDPLAYQYNEVVGRDHHSAWSGGYDIGLIKITNDSTLTRYATNDLYQYAEDDTYYDAEINEYSYLKDGFIVRKSGIKTNITSGTVVASYYEYNTSDGTFVGARVQTSDGSTFADHGDSGGIVYKWVSTYDEYWSYGLISAKITGNDDIFISRMSDVVKYYSDSTYGFYIKDDDPAVKVAD